MISVVSDPNHCHVFNIIIERDMEPAVTLEAVHGHPRALFAGVCDQFWLALFTIQLCTVKCVHVQLFALRALLLFFEACFRGKQSIASTPR